jgi:DNA-binding MarR family transcriptional regulator
MSSVQAKAASGKSAGGAPAVRPSDRSDLVQRFLDLQPVIRKRFQHELEHELRDEFQHVTIHQLTVLGHLRHHTLTMRELASELGVGESAATAVSDRLVRQGLVERHDDPHDRRIVRLELSAAGRSLVERLHESAAQKSATMLEALSDVQLAGLVDILETLASSFVRQHTCAGTCPGSSQPTNDGVNS